MSIISQFFLKALYTNNEQYEKEMKKTIHYNSIKKNKIFRSKLNQGDKKTCTLKTTKHC